MTKKITLTKKEVESIPHIRKRDGSVAPFNAEKIVNAVQKAFAQTGEGSPEDATFVMKKVIKDLLKLQKMSGGQFFLPTVELVQDMVEEQLMLEDFVKTAKSYILYRERRAEQRKEHKVVPEKVKKLAAESKKYFRNSLGEFVYYRTYAKWIDSEGRRETWVETVDRYVNFMKKNLGDKLTDKEYAEVREGILNQHALPSMRLMQFAGKAAETTNVAAYNCSYIAPSKLRDFAEVMYVSMCGTGAGWSVESENIQKLPQIQKQTGKKAKTHVVDDSKEGWCDALTLGMETWFAGEDIEFDYSKLRPAGARLKTMGGKSSGPDPLKRLLDFTRERILKRQGKRLQNIDAHDILCMIGNCVVSGGVRRSAMISLSDLEDTELRDAKKGQFWMTEPQRSLANNSAVYTQKPTNEEFMEEWLALMKSGSGERGIFNRGGLEKQTPARRWKTLKDQPTVGTNPCGEIILRSKQFCNLTEVVARAEDTEETLLKKVRLAAILGTYQASLTNFPYLSKEWKQNCEEEALLGVSLTGQWDSPAAREAEVLRALRDEAIKVNKKYAARFGINQAAAVTCVKPSGTVSKTFDTSAGMHPRHSQYYIQRIRISATDALFEMLKDQGVPYHPEVGQTMDSANTYVFEFPVQSPKGSIFKDDQTAIEQLEYWKNVKENYTEHNPSVTISVGDDEWVEVAAWLYKNWEILGGLSFLPRSNHVYMLAPYEAISKEKYDEMVAKFPEIDYSKLVTYEVEDNTDAKKELACVSGVCDLDDLLAAEANDTASSK